MDIFSQFMGDTGGGTAVESAAAPTAGNLDLSNLLGSNANLSGFGGPFAKGQSLESLGKVPISSGQQQQQQRPRRPTDDFLGQLFM